MINMPLPEPAWSKEQQQQLTDENDKEQADGDVAIVESAKSRDTTLDPPSALFKPIDYPSLHIFVSGYCLFPPSLSGRVGSSGSVLGSYTEGCEFEPLYDQCVVSLSKALYHNYS